MPEAIRLDHVTKQYRTGQRQWSMLKDSIQRTIMSPLGIKYPDDTRLAAINDISLSINKGERVAIIGPNGSGKSTLLKIISRVTTPDSGSLTVNGSLGALLEVTVGFHAELTGKENVYLNGILQGLTRNQIKERYPSIVSFSELDNLNGQNWMDTPVKWYSSGMYVRLGFAVTAFLEPDILLIDEALSVGDIAFQQKCFNRMDQIVRNGTTLLFVTQAMDAAKKLCTRGILLNRGRIVLDASMSQVASIYELSQARG